MARARSYQELADLEGRILERASRQRTKTGRKKKISRLSDNAASLTRQYRANIERAYKGYAADFKRRVHENWDNKEQSYEQMSQNHQALQKEKKAFLNKRISARIYRQGQSVG